MGSAIDAFAAQYGGTTTSSGGGSNIDNFVKTTNAKNWSPPSTKKVTTQTATTTPAPKKSLFNKITSTAKDFGNAAITGERQFATGIARDLPGGTADLDAQRKQAEQATKDAKFVTDQVKAGKISRARAAKILSANASSAGQAAKDTKDTIKAMPTKKDIALGAASTAADIATAGTFSKGKAGLVSAKELKPLVEFAPKAGRTGKTAAQLSKNAARKTAAANIALESAGNATAGVLNAAAGGGSGQDILKNGVAGALFPPALHAAGTVTTKAANSILDKIRAPKELVQKARQQTILDAASKKEATVAAEKTAKLDDKIELIKAKEADGKFTNVDKVKVKQLEAEKAALQPKATTSGDTPQSTPTPVESKSAMPVQTETPVVPAKSNPSESLPNNTPTEAPITYKKDLKTGVQTPMMQGDVIDRIGELSSIPKDKRTVSQSTELSDLKKVLKNRGSQETLAEPPTIKAFGKDIQLTEKNGYKATETPNGTIYSKMNRTGRNNKDSSLNMNYYDAQGRKIPNEQAHIALGHTEPKSTALTSKVKKAETKAEPTLDSFRVHSDKQLMDKKRNSANTPKKSSPVIKNEESSNDIPSVMVDKGTVLYHGTNKTFDKFDPAANKEDFGTWFGINKGDVEASKFKTIHERVIKPDTKLISEHELDNWMDSPEGYMTELPFPQDLQSKGFRGVKYDNGTVQLWHPNEDTIPVNKSTALTSKVKPADTPKIKIRVTTEPETKDVPQGTSKVAKRIAENIKQEYGDLASYDKITIEDQANKAAALMSDRAKLDKVISGEAPLPDGLRATSVITAISKDPELAKDADLIRKLAASPLASESSFSAQELRLARENARYNPITAIKNVMDARTKTFEERSGKTLAKATQSEAAKIKAATPKIPKETFASFVDSLRC